MNNSSGFRLTLVEVAVGMAIVILICALALPAIQHARESARRSECKNKLKQLGLAIANYEETHKVLPPGWIVVSDQNSLHGRETSAFGWGVYLIPYIDGNKIYKCISPGETSFRTGGPEPHGRWDDPNSDFFVGHYTHFSTVTMGIYRCPSDTGDSQTSKAVIPLAATNPYLANFGVGLPTSNHASDELQGLFGANSGVKLRHIKDGISHVIALGERRMFPGGSEWPAKQTQGNFNSYWAGVPDFDVVSPLAIVFTVTDGDITQRGVFDVLNKACQLDGMNTKPQPLRVFGINRTENDEPNVTTAGLSSHHGEGCFVVLLDCSVRFVSNGIHDNILIGLSRRSDGCQIPDEF